MHVYMRTARSGASCYPSRDGMIGSPIVSLVVLSRSILHRPWVVFYSRGQSGLSTHGVGVPIQKTDNMDISLSWVNFQSPGPLVSSTVQDLSGKQQHWPPDVINSPRGYPVGKRGKKASLWLSFPRVRTSDGHSRPCCSLSRFLPWRAE